MCALKKGIQQTFAWFVLLLITMLLLMKHCCKFHVSLEKKVNLQLSISKQESGLQPLSILNLHFPDFIIYNYKSKTCIFTRMGWMNSKPGDYKSLHTEMNLTFIITFTQKTFTTKCTFFCYCWCFFVLFFYQKCVLWNG